MVLVSEDRRRYGLILDRAIGFNLSLSSLRNLTSHHLIDREAEFRKNNSLFQSLRVKAPTMEALVGKLSGRQPAEGCRGQGAHDRAARGFPR